MKKLFAVSWLKADTTEATLEDRVRMLEELIANRDKGVFKNETEKRVKVLERIIDRRDKQLYKTDFYYKLCQKELIEAEFERSQQSLNNAKTVAALKEKIAILEAKGAKYGY